MHQDNLWAPWRMAYLRDLERRLDAVEDQPKTERNFLEAYWARPERDAEQFVIWRDPLGMILLNRYPYSNGHLLVALGDGRPTLLDYDAEQRACFWRLVDLATELVHLTLNPQGINIGVNQGDAAGAGIPEHLHAHLVPRWSGDTNFITTIGEIRVVPDALESIYADYCRAVHARFPDGRPAG